MQSFLVYFYDVAGHGPVTVETPLLGRPREEKARLQAAVQKKFPKSKPSEIRKIGSVIESRTPADPGFVAVFPGQTLHQLFSTPAGEVQHRRIGRVWFSGAPYEVQIVLNRGAGSVAVHLIPRIKQGASPIKFSNQIAPSTPADELEKIVRGVLGADVRDLVLLTRVGVPAVTAQVKTTKKVGANVLR